MVKMFRLVGEDKEYGVIIIGAIFPFSERAQGRIPFFFVSAASNWPFCCRIEIFDCVRYLDKADIV